MRQSGHSVRQVKALLRTRRERGAYTVTDAQRPMSEDIAYRQRRYLISMGIRVVAFLLAVFLFHGIWRFVAAAVALVVPYFAVVFANGGRERDTKVRFDPVRARLRAAAPPQRSLGPAQFDTRAGPPTRAAQTRNSPHPGRDDANSAAGGRRQG